MFSYISPPRAYPYPCARRLTGILTTDDTDDLDRDPLSIRVHPWSLVSGNEPVFDCSNLCFNHSVDVQLTAASKRQMLR